MHLLTRKSLFIAVALILLGGLMFFLKGHQSAPNVTFTTINGEKISMGALKGKVVLVNFWATDCVACVEEMPELVKIYHEYQPKGLEVIAVATPDDPPAQVLNYVTQKMLPFPVMHDGLGEMSEKFGNIAVTPTTYIFSKQGRQLQRTIGKLDFVKLNQLLSAELTTQKN